MSWVDILGCEAYEATLLKEKVPTFFSGCSASIGKIIEKKNIPKDMVLWVSYSKKDGWRHVDPTTVRKRKLFLRKEWVEQNIPGYGDNNMMLDLEPAPPLLELEEHEKFRDAKGQVVNIEVRGKRDVDKIWFRARDVETMIEMTDITVTLSNNESTFLRTDDYEYFIPLETKIPCELSNKTTRRKTVFLTYQGLLRLLFVRRHPIARQFQKWAARILFTHAHGSMEQKEDLGADLMGVRIETLREVLNCSVDDFPCVYLFGLGSAANVRDTIPNRLPDETTIFKFGFTGDLKRRTEDHSKTFGRHITLKWHVYVDPTYLSQAEVELKKALAGFLVDHPKHTELVGINDRVLNSTIHCIFKNIGKQYAGRLREMQEKMERMRLEKDLNEQHFLEREKGLQETVVRNQRHFSEKQSILEQMMMTKEQDYLEKKALYEELLRVYRQEP